MLRKEKELNCKLIRGKRIRERTAPPYFILFFPILLAFPICSIAVGFFWEVLWILLLMFLPVFLLLVLVTVIYFRNRRVICIISEDKLYFLRMTLAEAVGSTGKKRQSVCDGSVDLDDIKNMKHIPAVRRWLGKRTVTVAPEYVILQGIDFQITVRGGGKALIRKIESLRKAPVDSAELCAIPDFDSMEFYRSGVWKAIWESFEKNGGEGIFDEQTRITDFYNDGADDLITVSAVRNGREFIFDIDSECLNMYVADDDRESSVQLSSISGVKELYARMSDFVLKG
ncbi:MAG: hypothetical protein IJ011_04470 [Clostridia bacterium]|nr:hypothetical protein [Clostridia bacterium]